MLSHEFQHYLRRGQYAMTQWVCAAFRTVCRVFFLVVVGYLLATIVSLLAIALLAVCFGGLERGLEQLPKSRFFVPAILGYFAAICAAGIGFLMGGLLQVSACKNDFYRAVWRKALPMATVAAAIAAIGGIIVGFTGLGRVLSTQLAFGTGIWVGFFFPLVVWAVPRFYRRPAESE